MYLHIGKRQSVKKSDVIGIFDLDTSTVTKTGKEFINRLERAGAVEYADDDLPRSFVLINENGKNKVKLSRISTKGLMIRVNESEYDNK